MAMHGEVVIGVSNQQPLEDYSETAEKYAESRGSKKG